MNKLSPPALILFLAGVFGAIFIKDQFLVFDGALEYAASAGIGALGGLVGATAGIIIFPKPGDHDD